MVTRPHLTRYASKDVTLLGDQRRPGGVTLAFSERTGGRSLPPYASLNVGIDCGDDAQVVAANRALLLEALGMGELGERLVNPLQVHGDDVLVVATGTDDAVREVQVAARKGVDAIVCSAQDVPVLLCYADCVPVVLVAPGAFAVVHSGWKGTKARIAAKALRKLVELAGCTPADVLAYIGPHISGADYEVSHELAETFADEFGEVVTPDERHLDLGSAVRVTLEGEGVQPEAILDDCPSTASCTNRFFSFRAEGGTCGRHGAIAALLSGTCEEVSANA